MSKIIISTWFIIIIHITVSKSYNSTESPETILNTAFKLHKIYKT